jgi:hypothetical protein
VAGPVAAGGGMTTIRGVTADGADGDRLSRLAALSGTRVPEGAVLLAEVEGEPVAAIGVFDSHAISDPARSSLALRMRLRLLRVPLMVLATIYGI